MGVHGPSFWAKKAGNGEPITAVRSLEGNFMEQRTVALADYVVAPSQYILQVRTMLGFHSAGFRCIPLRSRSPCGLGGRAQPVHSAGEWKLLYFPLCSAAFRCVPFSVFSGARGLRGRAQPVHTTGEGEARSAFRQVRAFLLAARFVKAVPSFQVLFLAPYVVRTPRILCCEDVRMTTKVCITTQSTFPGVCIIKNGSC